MGSDKLRLNLHLSSGLTVAHCKLHKGTNVATLFVTDFLESTRALFDLDGGALVGKHPFAFTAKDAENVSASIKKAVADKNKPKTAPKSK